jgi:hypothetical protein
MNRKGYGRKWWRSSLMYYPGILHGWTEENHEKPQAVQLDSGLGFETGRSQTPSKHSATKITEHKKLTKDHQMTSLSN